MTTLGSWIDEETVAGLGRDLASAPAGESAAGTGAALPLTRLTAEDFRLPENYLPAPFPGPDSEERRRAQAMLRNIRQKAEAAGLLGGRPSAALAAPEPGDLPGPAVPSSSESLPAGNVPYFTPPAGPLATRIRAFLDWVRRHVNGAETFIVDSHGNPLTDRDAGPELASAALQMAEAGRRALRHLPAAGAGGVHLDLPGGRKLCIIDTQTDCGAFCLGMVLPEALSGRAADRFRRALKRTVEAESPAPPRRERW